jgi:hypothetical protein
MVVLLFIKAMDSIKTNAKDYTIINEMCFAQIVAIPENGGFRIYVAWEWEAMAKKGIFAFIKSRTTFKVVTEQAIIETAERGFDIGGTGEEKRVFALLF